jgi:hypothetical protein
MNAMKKLTEIIEAAYILDNAKYHKLPKITAYERTYHDMLPDFNKLDDLINRLNPLEMASVYVDSLTRINDDPARDITKDYNYSLQINTKIYSEMFNQIKELAKKPRDIKTKKTLASIVTILKDIPYARTSAARIRFSDQLDPLWKTVGDVLGEHYVNNVLKIYNYGPIKDPVYSFVEHRHVYEIN